MIPSGWGALSPLLRTWPRPKSPNLLVAGSGGDEYIRIIFGVPHGAEVRDALDERLTMPQQLLQSIGLEPRLDAETLRA